MDYTEFKVILDRCKIGMMFDENNIPELNIVLLPDSSIRTSKVDDDVKHRFQEKQDRIDVLERDFKQVCEKFDELKCDNERLTNNLEEYKQLYRKAVAELGCSNGENDSNKAKLDELNRKLADVLIKYTDLLEKNLR
jgi:chromosome segregation ATPase